MCDSASRSGPWCVVLMAYLVELRVAHAHLQPGDASVPAGIIDMAAGARAIL